VSVDVVNVFMTSKDAAFPVLCDEPMLGDIAVSVGMGMPWRHHVGVATSDDASTFPRRITGSGLDLMAKDIAHKVALPIASIGLVGRGAWRWLSATAQTQTCWICRFYLHSFRFAGFSIRRSARPMSSNTGLALRRCVTAATAARLSVFHVRNVAH
jgi:hypothetical protein